MDLGIKQQAPVIELDFAGEIDLRVTAALGLEGHTEGVRGQRSPRVMFSKRGKKQFAPYKTKAVEHFADIFFT